MGNRIFFGVAEEIRTKEEIPLFVRLSSREIKIERNEEKWKSEINLHFLSRKKPGINLWNFANAFEDVLQRRASFEKPSRQNSRVSWKLL